MAGQDKLIPGLEFAKAHNVSPAENIMLLEFMRYSHSLESICKKMGLTKSAAQSTINRLKLKGLVVVVQKEKDNKVVYGFNPLLKF